MKTNADLFSDQKYQAAVAPKTPLRNPRVMEFDTSQFKSS
jgi:hypothetical protein